MIKKRKHIPSRDEIYLLDRIAIDCNGCWNWKGYTDSKGYGIAVLADHTKKLAHRLSYETFVAPILEGNGVYHHCDNPSCINPEHLFSGTQLDNMHDMIAKGRGRKVRGVDHHKSILTEDQVLEIFHDQAPNSEVALRHGLRHSVVWSIRTGRTWRHVTNFGA